MMKKNNMFLYSTLAAIALAIYCKNQPNELAIKLNPTWKTFTKNSKLEVSGHLATQKDLEEARVPTPRRTIAEENVNNEDSNALEQEKIITDNHFSLRENRVLLGDFKKSKFQNENVSLAMANKINPKWKEILGQEMLRFQSEDTKIMIKQEFSIIQIENGKGRYTEQVIITYVLHDGRVNSYRALIDSETGVILNTWDKSIHENYKKNLKNESTLTIPLENNSGIKAR